MNGIQWNKPGDHPGVTAYDRAHIVDLNYRCPKCLRRYIENGQYTHGRIEAPEEYWNTDPADYIICPGDWIYQLLDGSYYPDNDRHLIDELRDKRTIIITQNQTRLIYDIMYVFDHIEVKNADSSCESWLITLPEKKQ